MADWKPEPISSSSLIRVGGTNFANINSVQELRSMQAGAGHHRVFERSQGIVAFDDNNVGRSAQVRVPVIKTPNSLHSSKWGIGVPVRDKEGRKGIIIEASAGYTKKTRTPVYRIANKRGDSWLAKQSELEML